MFVRNGHLYIIRMMCITRLNVECRYHFVIGHDSIFTFRQIDNFTVTTYLKFFCLSSASGFR